MSHQEGLEVSPKQLNTEYLYEGLLLDWNRFIVNWRIKMIITQSKAKANMESGIGLTLNKNAS